MGRRAKFTSEQILDTASWLLARGGTEAATMVAVAAKLGAPSGSVYHRFSSREVLLGSLWIRTVRRFQIGYLEALADPDVHRAQERAVRHVLRWSADNPHEARILLLYSRAELLASWPEELGADLATLNDDVQAAIIRYASARFGAADAELIDRVRLALIDIPYAFVRHALLDAEPIAGWMIQAATDASLAVLHVRRPHTQEIR